MRGRTKRGMAMRIWAVAALLALAAAFVGFAGGQTEGETQLRFAVAPPDGEWYVIASGMWDVWQRNVNGLTVNILPGGGHGNVVAVGSGKAELGMASSTDIYGGYRGVTPFKPEEKFADLRLLFALTPNAQYTVVWKDSGMKRFQDVKGKRINIKPEGYSSNALHKLIVKAAGMSLEDFQPERVGDADAVQLMQDGHLDGMMSGGLIPDSAFIELSNQRPIAILQYDDSLIKNVTAMNAGLFPITIPAGTYRGLDSDVSTIGYTLAVCVNKNVNDQVIYEMTKTLAEHFKTLQDSVAAFKPLKPADLARPLGVPFHPGAERYYKEQGWVK